MDYAINVFGGRPVGGMACNQPTNVEVGVEERGQRCIRTKVRDG